MREGAHYFRFSRRERENRGLDGGEGQIRTVGALSHNPAKILGQTG
jgi:hypothetical protein